MKWRSGLMCYRVKYKIQRSARLFTSTECNLINSKVFAGLNIFSLIKSSFSLCLLPHLQLFHRFVSLSPVVFLLLLLFYFLQEPPTSRQLVLFLVLHYSCFQLVFPDPAKPIGACLLNWQVLGTPPWTLKWEKKKRVVIIVLTFIRLSIWVTIRA